MRRISFKALKGQPMRVRVLYGIAFICSWVGLITMMLDAFDICEIKLCVSMAFITAGLLINNVLLAKRKNQFYK